MIEVDALWIGESVDRVGGGDAKLFGEETKAVKEGNRQKVASKWWRAAIDQRSRAQNSCHSLEKMR